MKKFLCIMISLIMVFSLVGCSGNSEIDRESATLGQLKEGLEGEFENEDSSINDVELVWIETTQVLDRYGDTKTSTEENEYKDILKNALETKDKVKSVNEKSIKNSLVKAYCNDYMEFADKILTCIINACRETDEDKSFKYFSTADNIKSYTDDQKRLYESYIGFGDEALKITIGELRLKDDLDNKLEKIKEEMKNID